MKVEKAKIEDVREIHRLVNFFAQRDEMLPRALSEIYENLRDFFVVREEGQVVACAALHVNWSDLAEIKSLAVAEEWQNRQMGASLIKASLEEAKGLGIPTVFCLTYKSALFQKFGFHEVDKMELPRKVWSECYRCPKFPNCDEIALVCNLAPTSPRTGESKPRPKEERTLNSRRIYQGRAVGLRVDTVAKPSGRETTREIVEHGDCVAVVAIDGQNNVLLVRQFRKPTEKVLLEIPAGGIKPDEAPVECVRRELREEIGYLPQTIKDLGGFYSSPGYSTEYLHLYLATELKPEPLHAEDTESIEIVPVPLEQIPQLIASGEINDAKSIAGLLRVIGESPK